jgi:hypothetical protein
MKRSPMRRDSDKSKAWARRRKPINKLSGKRRKQIEAERPIREEYLREHYYCEVRKAGAPDKCPPLSVEAGELHIHEPLTRARGGSTGDTANMKTACNWHNGWLSQTAEGLRWGLEHRFLFKAGRNDD